jgi:hypothetical protein
MLLCNPHIAKGLPGSFVTLLVEFFDDLAWLTPHDVATPLIPPASMMLAISLYVTREKCTIRKSD